MTSGNGCLQRVGAKRATCAASASFGARERTEAASNQQLILTRAILIEQQDGFPGRTSPRA